MVDFDYDYYKTGAGKTALSLPTWTNILTDLDSTERASITTNLEANDCTWPPLDTPAGG